MLKIPFGTFPIDIILKTHIKPKDGFAFAGIVK